MDKKMVAAELVKVAKSLLSREMKVSVNKVSIVITPHVLGSFIIQVQVYRDYPLLDEREFSSWTEHAESVLDEVTKLLQNNDYVFNPGQVPPQVNMKTQMCSTSISVWKRNKPDGRWESDLRQLLKSSSLGRYVV